MSKPIEEPVLIDGVKKLNLKPTALTANLSFYEETLCKPAPQPKVSPHETAYNTLSIEQKQALSDGENTVFEVTRRAKILLEKAQRIAEDTAAQALPEKDRFDYNKPFNPSAEQIKTKFFETVTATETAKINAALAAKAALKQQIETIAKVKEENKGENL